MKPVVDKTGVDETGIIHDKHVMRRIGTGQGLRIRL